MWVSPCDATRTARRLERYACQSQVALGVLPPQLELGTGFYHTFVVFFRTPNLLPDGRHVISEAGRGDVEPFQKATEIWYTPTLTRTTNLYVIHDRAADGSRIRIHERQPLELDVQGRGPG